ncbi:hypothetical protein OPIT5_16040 [Opitutaceae bacterium TAV5]|nr:hypothetical protein OPIT5_16040 [Opitutaceae bacterium TAV5]
MPCKCIAADGFCQPDGHSTGCFVMSHAITTKLPDFLHKVRKEREVPEKQFFAPFVIFV